MPKPNKPPIADGCTCRHCDTFYFKSDSDAPHPARFCSGECEGEHEVDGDDEEEED